jgi:hypothetical protein
MHHRNERNAIIQHGTMTLVRRQALERVGGWGEWCICEDAELGLRLMAAGHEVRYVDEVLGRGLTPADFKAFKAQRFRWAFGAMQILKAHARALLGQSALTAGQRYHFLTGWFRGSPRCTSPAAGALAWTIARSPRGLFPLPLDRTRPALAFGRKTVSARRSITRGSVQLDRRGRRASPAWRFPARSRAEC